MDKNRFIYISVSLALAVTVLFTVRTVVATNAVVAQGRDLSDYALRHPESLKPAIAPDASDYFQRHPELWTLSKGVDLSDYALRHPELWGPSKGTNPSSTTP